MNCLWVKLDKAKKHMEKRPQNPQKELGDAVERQKRGSPGAKNSKWGQGNRLIKTNSKNKKTRAPSDREHKAKTRGTSKTGSRGSL